MRMDMGRSRMFRPQHKKVVELTTYDILNIDGKGGAYGKNQNLYSWVRSL